MGGILHLALQEGFEDDAVVLRVDGEEVYRRDSLATRMQIGLADSLELTVEEDEVELEVSLPKRSLACETKIAVAGTTYVGVSVELGAVSIRTQQEPFGYV